MDLLSLSLSLSERERQRETETETERNTHRERHRERERQPQWHREIVLKLSSASLPWQNPLHYLKQSWPLSWLSAADCCRAVHIVLNDSLLDGAAAGDG